jgi:hypothetical protein
LTYDPGQLIDNDRIGPGTLQWDMRPARAASPKRYVGDMQSNRIHEEGIGI